MSPRALGLLILLALPVASAHGNERHPADEQLVERGEKLMLGGFEGAQAGPLLVVPFVDGPLPCSEDDLVSYRVPLNANATVAIHHNRTHIEAGFATSPQEHHYLGFAADTGEAVRALFLMREYVVPIHLLAAAVLRADNVTLKAGHLGVPYPAGPAAHGIDHPLEGGGISIAYADEDAEGSCGHAPNRTALWLDKARMGDRASPGRLLHAVILYDPNFDQFLPRPIDDSTTIFQAHLYLARPGEDPEAVRAAFDPRPGLAELLPLGLLGLMLVLVGIGAWSTPRP